MIRGTTPKFVFTIKNIEDFSTIEEVWFTIKDSNGVAVNKTLKKDEVILDAEALTISCTLGQLETLSLTSGKAKVQLKVQFTDETIWASAIGLIAVDEVLNARPMQTSDEIAYQAAKKAEEESNGTTEEENEDFDISNDDTDNAG